MIAFMGGAMHAVAAAAALTAAPAPTMSPATVVTRYVAALSALHEPHTFTVDYTLEQSGTRHMEQTHRIFRSGGDERDETIAVNGNRALKPTVRIFRGRPYRYAVGRLAPRPADYVFTYVGPHKDGRHVSYVFHVERKTPKAFPFTQVAIDGITYLPNSVAFAIAQNDGRGTVNFAKSDRYWVATAASASAKVPGGSAHERLTFGDWKFPKTLPASTFAGARPLPTKPPAPG